ncbi:hypothetical protein [Lentzea aerocolonigenes]|uniref:hypothetical protein n=1 Tax=Lentzea aerocolonigenes TaxID=68170 RepID=UPI000750B7BA|nr:hypothetical protein [Lentzea aerocolonigenes]MCP2242722.1 hypothetical protein [Lentzea aerocolonigenes]
MRFFAMWPLAAFGSLLKLVFWAAVIGVLCYLALPESLLPLAFAALGGFVLAMVLVLKAVTKSRSRRGER